MSLNRWNQPHSIIDRVIDKTDNTDYISRIQLLCIEYDTQTKNNNTRIHTRCDRGTPYQLLHNNILSVQEWDPLWQREELSSDL